jgi:hypothetical protein
MFFEYVKVELIRIKKNLIVIIIILFIILYLVLQNSEYHAVN